MNIIFVVRGNLYSVLLSTAVSKAIRTQYPTDSIIVVCDFPEVYFGCTFIDRVYRFGALHYFYTDYIEQDDFIIFDKNPFDDQRFISDKIHVLETWCAMHQIVYSNELPCVFLSEIERKDYLAQFKTNRPILLINFFNVQDSYCWHQDIPNYVALRLVKEFSKNNDVYIISEKVIWELDYVKYINPNYKDLVYLTSLADHILTINSVLHLVATALKKQCTVCWNIDNFNQYAYKSNANIVGLQPNIKIVFEDAFTDKYQHNGQDLSIPYTTTDEIFDTLQIATSFTHFKKETYYPQFIESNRILRQKVFVGVNKLKMVSLRVYHLLNLLDISNVRYILDIGSCDLRQSIEFAELFEDATVFAFEPVLESFNNCEHIKGTLELELRERICVNNLAISDKEGMIDFYPVDAMLSDVPNVGASSMFQFLDGLKGTMFSQNLIQKHEVVQSMTLDSWRETTELEQIDIIWLDVQGAELLVFKGGIETLKRTKVILTEVGIKPYYNGHTLKPEIDSFLSEIGFQEYKDGFQLSVVDYKANAIYVNKRFKY